jgi:hypothetical protein
MDTRTKERLDSLEYVLDNTMKKHCIYPMKLKDRTKVATLFSKVNDEYPILNLPRPLEDDNGKLVLDEDGETIENIEPFEAMKELLELALADTWDHIEPWIDLGHISAILAAYRKLSGLKKKLDAQMAMLTGIPSMPGLPKDSTGLTQTSTN